MRTVSVLLDAADVELIERRFSEMEADILARFATGEGPPPELHRRADCRYLGQGYELPISCETIGEGWRAEVATAFHAQHEHEYGFDFPGHPIEVVNLRVTAVAQIEARPATRAEPGGGDPAAARTGTARILFALVDGPVEATAYDRERLRAGDRFAGPAVVHEMDSTVVVSPGWQGEVLDDGTILLSARKEA